MKKRGFTILTAIVTCVTAMAFCGNAAGAARLELKLAKGKTYYERTLVDQTIKQSVMGQDQTIQHAIGVGQKLDVLDVDAQGNMQIRYTYVWSRFKQTGPMGTTDYDSSKGTPAPTGAEAFAAMIGEGYTARISPKGKVLDVSGTEQLAEAVRKKAPGVDPSSTMDFSAYLLSKDGIRESIEGELAMYPDQAVEVGASWSEKRLMKMGLAMIVDSKWTLQKREGGVATIASTASLKPDPNAPPMEMQGMKMKMDVSGTQEGTIQMAETTGLPKVNRTLQKLGGQIKIATSAEGQYDMVIPSTFETTSVSEISDRMWETKPQP